MLLNYLPLRFESDVFNGGVLSFESERNNPHDPDKAISQRLRELRREHRATHFFYRSGNEIFCVPLTADVGIIGSPRTFNVHLDFQLANALARNALLRFFTQAGKVITEIRPVSFVWLEHNLAPTRQDIFGFYPEYSFDVRPLAPHEGEITSGVLVEFSIRHVFLKPAGDISAEGVALSGLYVVAPAEQSDRDVNLEFSRRYLGKIESVEGTTARLSDSDVNEIDLRDCFLEGSLSNFEFVGRSLLGKEYDTLWTGLQQRSYGVTGAESQVERLKKVGDWLERQSPFPCCDGLRVRIHKKPHECLRGTDAGFSHSFRTPQCVLRPGGSITVPWPVDKQIDAHGPYDAESFPEKRVRIAVVCPQEFVGEVGQFLKQLKDGVPSPDERTPFRQGMVRKYHLNSCDFSFHEVKPGAPLEEAYKNASLEALAEDYHLGLVVIREQYRDLPDASNPYYTTKARMMAQGMPVQVLEIESVRLPGRAYILNNIALAMYAKLGGIPWVLSPNPDLVHEIIFGIGSARISESRRGGGERVIGITTVFSGDGQYLLANSTREVNSEDYLSALDESLQGTVEELRRRYGWQAKDRVRFIFHQSFKKYKEIEANAVKEFAGSLSDFDVQYAFVHVSMNHNWRLFDPKAIGAKFRQGMKGRMVPNRGLCVPLGPHTALVTLTGPYQLKTDLQGCPHPVLVSIHEQSTFKSLDYIAQQVFNLSFMSWRGFNPSTLPVSISYSNMIVDLLGHLRYVRNWNPETLRTKLRDRRWFL